MQQRGRFDRKEGKIPRVGIADKSRKRARIAFYSIAPPRGSPGIALSYFISPLVKRPLLGRFQYGTGVSVVTFESLDEAEAYIRG